MEKQPNPWVAFLLSLCQVGLGHFYNGSPVRGIILWVIPVAVLAPLGAMFLMGSFWGMVVFLLLAITYWLGVAIMAGFGTRKPSAAKPHWSRRWFVLAAFAVGMAVLANVVFLPAIKSAARYRAFRIPTAAMTPTLQVGDYLYADTWHYREGEPQRGDVVVFRYPRDPEIEYVKRCIAVPGDRVEIRDKVVYLNGSALDEEYVWHNDEAIHRLETRGDRARRDQIPAFIVSEGSYFMLGDNRDNSMDSRYFGPVPYSLLRGKMKYIYWSKDLSRLGMEIGAQ